MKHFDAVAREFQRVERMRLASLDRRGDFILRNPRAGGGEVESIELSRVIAQRLVLVSRNARNFSAKSAARVSRRMAMLCLVRNALCAGAATRISSLLL